MEKIARMLALTPSPAKGTAIGCKNAGSRGNFFPTCDMESPLTPTLSPLIKGGEGREWGDPACENPLPHAPKECGWCALVSTPSPHPLWSTEAPIPHSKTARGITNPALLRACKEFEAIFVLQLWRAMQRTVPTSRKTLNYTEMFDLQFADYLSRQGRFGLAEQLYAQLSRYLPDAGEKR